MKIKAKNALVKIPIIMEFGDYHEINHMLDSFNEIFSDKLKVKELSGNGYYYAIFYFKKDKEYQFLVKGHESVVAAESDE